MEDELQDLLIAAGLGVILGITISIILIYSLYG